MSYTPAECFQAIVSAEDVHRGKPDPEVFLIAATRLGVAPEHCIVVEDAEHGLEAARAAGMKSIGVSREMASLCRQMWWCDLSTLWKRTPSNNLLQDGASFS